MITTLLVPVDIVANGIRPRLLQAAGGPESVFAPMTRLLVNRCVMRAEIETACGKNNPGSRAKKFFLKIKRQKAAN